MHERGCNFWGLCNRRLNSNIYNFKDPCSAIPQYVQGKLPFLCCVEYMKCVYETIKNIYIHSSIIAESCHGRQIQCYVAQNKF